VTSGSPGQYRAFYEQPKPVEFDVELPDDIDGPDDLRDFLLDEAPFSRQAAVRVEPVTPGAPVLVPPSVQERPEGVPEGQDTGDTVGEALSDAETLVGIITARDYFPLWSTPTDSHAAAMAERILGAGFRRVPEDAERLSAELADLRYGLALRACTAPDADIDTMLGSLDARLRDALAADPKEVQS